MTERGLPSTFVPGRNLVFFIYAAALADRRGLKALVGGMCETDFSGYPDCRRDTLDAMQTALNLGMERDFRIETPLMRLTKARDLGAGQGLGGEALVELILEDSHTCYLGEREQRARLGLRLRRPARPASCAPRAGSEWRRPAERRPALTRPMSYAVKEIFLTLQGEGGQAGPRGGVLPLRRLQPVVRPRGGPRRRAVCNFCDTDFVGMDGAGRRPVRHAAGAGGGGRRRPGAAAGATGWWSAPAASPCCSSTRR